MKKFTTLLISIFIFTSCDITTETSMSSTTSYAEAEATLTMGTHDVTIKPSAPHTSSGSVTKNNKTKYTFNVGKNKVIIDDEQLYVNNKSYGSLNKNDTVDIENDIVKINNKTVSTQSRKR